MTYDFTSILDRKDKDSIAANIIPFENYNLDNSLSVIPMWVADMSFAVAPPVKEAINKRLTFPNFGYYSTPDEYYNSVINWHKTRNCVENLTKECIGYENGVLGGVSTAISAFTAPGEAVFVNSSTYVGFTGVLKGLGRTAVHSELVRDKNGIWRMDYEDMDRKIKESHIHLAILCSPHNPCGRVWERDELEKVMEIFRENDCIVISDEIWSDIIMPGHQHIPTQSVSEDAKQRTIAFYSPSKTFSLAGLIGSYNIIYNHYLRDRMMKQSSNTHYNSANVLSVHALIGAYSDSGALWTDEMISVVNDNLAYACDYINTHFDSIKVMRPEGTYMMYLDCGEWCRSHSISSQDLRLRGINNGIIWQNGDDFLLPDSIRMNYTLPKSLAVEAMKRLGKFVFI